LAAVTASIRVQCKGTLPSSVVSTIIVAARANPDIARNKSGSVTAASLKRRFGSAMEPLPAAVRQRWQILTS
jgi:hypothetical protein